MQARYMNHTAFRIADPKRSIEFYGKHFGLKLLKTLENKQSGYSSYILGLTGPKSLYQQEPFYTRGGLLQLEHHHSSTIANFQANNGNKEPYRGFGHICFSVSNLEATCERLEKNDVKFQKRLVDGRQKDIAFALDPDGYWIELVSNGQNDSEQAFEDTSARLNHSMIRVKDKDASLKFYTERLGMKLVDTLDFPEAKFTLYFLSLDPQVEGRKGRPNAEGLIELTYNYGSEKDDSVHYHNGNEDPKGFSHFGIAVAEPKSFVKDLSGKGVKTVRDFGTEGLEYAATIADPDGYHIRVLPMQDYTNRASNI